MTAQTVHCAICGHSESSEVIDEIASTDTGERFSIQRCNECGTNRTEPVPDDLAPYYATDLAATMTDRGNGLFALLRQVQLTREVGRLGAAEPPGTILDIGCGNGSFTSAARRRGHTVVAADANHQRPESLVDRPDIPYTRFDFDTFELAATQIPGPYTVVLRHVLEHVRNPTTFLRELVALGGRSFYIVVPNVESTERRIFGKYWYMWDPPRHLWHFDRPSLNQLCDRAGLDIITQGSGTTSTLLPCLYRYLRLNDFPPTLYRAFGPTSLLTGLMAPLSLFLPGNVLWLVARSR